MPLGARRIVRIPGRPTAHRPERPSFHPTIWLIQERGSFGSIESVPTRPHGRGQRLGADETRIRCTSFEILFALDENKGKTKQFIEAVERVITSKNTILARRTDYRGRSQNYSLPGWWAHDFYDLRSRIVHGDVIDHAAIQYAQWITHGIVADLVYWQCLVAELYELKCVGDSIRELAKEWDAAFPDEKPGTAEPLLAEWFLGFEPYQQVLGWIPKST